MYRWQRERYPNNWEVDYSQKCIKKADGRCEECGIYGKVWRIKQKHAWKMQYTPLPIISDIPIPDEWIKQNSYQVNLNAAHEDHDPWNINPRLKALCQDCHFKHDRFENGEKARKTRRKQWETFNLKAGQLPIDWSMS